MELPITRDNLCAQNSVYPYNNVSNLGGAPNGTSFLDINTPTRILYYVERTHLLDFVPKNSHVAFRLLLKLASIGYEI